MGYNAAIHLDWGVFFELEVPAPSLAARLPPGVEATRTVNGKAIVSLNLAHFLAGGDQVDLPENHEIDVGVVVPADNSGHANQPQATSAVHVLNIGSTEPDYLNICNESGYPAHPMRDLRFDIRDDGLEGVIRDADGSILSFALQTDSLAYTAFSRVGQDVIHDHRGEYRLNYVFEGEELADPAIDSFSLNLHDHPFFEGLEISTVTPRCRSQFALRTGKRASISFFGPD